jgi:hypothetical protein
MKKNNILIIIAGLAIFATLFLWAGYFRTKPAPFVVEIKQNAQSPIDLAAGREFTILLETIQKTKIDSTFFEDPIYKSLVDFTPAIVLPAEKGRKNPFLRPGSLEQTEKQTKR